MLCFRRIRASQRKKLRSSTALCSLLDVCDLSVSSWRVSRCIQLTSKPDTTQRTWLTVELSSLRSGIHRTPRLAFRHQITDLLTRQSALLHSEGSGSRQNSSLLQALANNALCLRPIRGPRYMLQAVATAAEVKWLCTGSPWGASTTQPCAPSAGFGHCCWAAGRHQCAPWSLTLCLGPLRQRCSPCIVAHGFCQEGCWESYCCGPMSSLCQGRPATCRALIFMVEDILRQGRLKCCNGMSAAMHLICGLEGV